VSRDHGEHEADALGQGAGEERGEDGAEGRPGEDGRDGRDRGVVDRLEVERHVRRRREGGGERVDREEGDDDEEADEREGRGRLGRGVRHVELGRRVDDVRRRTGRATDERASRNGEERRLLGGRPGERLVVRLVVRAGAASHRERRVVELGVGRHGEAEDDLDEGDGAVRGEDEPVALVRRVLALERRHERARGDRAEREADKAEDLIVHERLREERVSAAREELVRVRARGDARRHGPRAGRAGSECRSRRR